MVHNCQKQLEEGQGCSICSKIGRLTKEEIKKIQEHINWKILELSKENIVLRTENRKLKKDI